MSEEEYKNGPKKYIAKADGSKPIKKQQQKSRFPVDVEAERRFDELKRKYANAVAFLLVKNIPRLGLQEYFDESEDNKRRYGTIKRMRQAIIESRPKAKLWVDKAFYLKLDLGQAEVSEDGVSTVSIVLGECVFKQPTHVVANRYELDAYLETIAKIIESEKVWADPDMADFDIGEREYLKDTPMKPVPAAPVNSGASSDQLQLETQ